MKELICIICPRGCRLQIDTATRSVSGNDCENGAEYAGAELENPLRVLTGTVKLQGGSLPRCPVRTSVPIPKRILSDAMALLSDLTLEAPVRIGQIAVENILGTGADLIVTRNID